MFSSRGFYGFSSCIEVSDEQCEVGVQFHSPACGYSVVPATFVEVTIPHHHLSHLGILVKNQLPIHPRLLYMGAELCPIDVHVCPCTNARVLNPAAL